MGRDTPASGTVARSGRGWTLAVLLGLALAVQLLGAPAARAQDAVDGVIADVDFHCPPDSERLRVWVENTGEVAHAFAVVVVKTAGDDVGATRSATVTLEPGERERQHFAFVTVGDSVQIELLDEDGGLLDSVSLDQVSCVGGGVDEPDDVDEPEDIDEPEDVDEPEDDVEEVEDVGAGGRGEGEQPAPVSERAPAGEEVPEAEEEVLPTRLADTGPGQVPGLLLLASALLGLGALALILAGPSVGHRRATAE